MVIKYDIYIYIVGNPGRVIMTYQRYSRGEENKRDAYWHGSSFELILILYKYCIYICIYICTYIYIYIYILKLYLNTVSSPVIVIILNNLIFITSSSYM